jgi:hypothetical protein
VFERDPESIGDWSWVDTLLQQIFARSKQSPGNNDNWSCTVTGLGVLSFGGFDKLKFLVSGKMGEFILVWRRKNNAGPIKIFTILAVGCSTDKFFNIVAPSLVIKVSPLAERIILSIPFGPKELLRRSANPIFSLFGQNYL